MGSLSPIFSSSVLSLFGQTISLFFLFQRLLCLQLGSQWFRILSYTFWSFSGGGFCIGRNSSSWHNGTSKDNTCFSSSLSHSRTNQNLFEGIRHTTCSPRNSTSDTFSTSPSLTWFIHSWNKPFRWAETLQEKITKFPLNFESLKETIPWRV